MKGLALPVAAAALLALGALVALEVLRPAPVLTPVEHGLRIAADLRCPDCQSLSVAESHTAAAGAIREQIGELLAQGRNADEIKQHFVNRYGEWILLAPAAAFAWWLPPLVVATALAILTAWLLAGRRARAGAVEPKPGLPAADRQRIRDEIEQLDA
ncbi:MAG: cytochrome c-type biogenesis protein CcmH [Candidatus Limnocylindria bacterium]